MPVADGPGGGVGVRVLLPGRAERGGVALARGELPWRGRRPRPVPALMRRPDKKPDKKPDQKPDKKPDKKPPTRNPTRNPRQETRQETHDKKPDKKPTTRHRRSAESAAQVVGPGVRFLVRDFVGAVWGFAHTSSGGHVLDRSRARSRAAHLPTCLGLGGSLNPSLPLAGCRGLWPPGSTIACLSTGHRIAVYSRAVGQHTQYCFRQYRTPQSRAVARYPQYRQCQYQTHAWRLSSNAYVSTGHRVVQP
eukprot:3940990-Rhodomonas_salina.1